DVTGAAADVARQVLPDLGLRRGRVPLQEVDRGEYEARRAEAALEAVLVLKRPLDRVQFAGLREPFDRLDRGAVRLDGEQQARAAHLAVERDRAGAADALPAADVRSRQTELVTDEVGEQRPRLRASGPFAPVDGPGAGRLGGNCLHPLPLPPARERDG